jgi:hypothetical protein
MLQICPLLKDMADELRSMFSVIKGNHSEDPKWA